MFSRDRKRGVGVRISIIFVVLVLSLILFSENIAAFGISTPYLENDILKVNPGKHYTYTLNIQNGDDSNYYVDIVYFSTNNIATLKKTEYYVPSEIFDNTVYFDIAIPGDAKLAQIYILDYSAKPRVNNNDTIPLGVEIKRRLTIFVTNETSLEIPATVSQQEIVNKSSELVSYNRYYSVFLLVKRYLLSATLLIILSLVLVVICVRMWKLSKGLSSKLGTERVSKYAISEAKNINELKELIKKIHDEEFDLEEIRVLLEIKLSELMAKDKAQEFSKLSRKELLIKLN